MKKINRLEALPAQFSVKVESAFGEPAHLEDRALDHFLSILALESERISGIGDLEGDFRHGRKCRFAHGFEGLF